MRPSRGPNQYVFSNITVFVRNNAHERWKLHNIKVGGGRVHGLLIVQGDMNDIFEKLGVGDTANESIPRHIIIFGRVLLPSSVTKSSNMFPNRKYNLKTYQHHNIDDIF